MRGGIISRINTLEANLNIKDNTTNVGNSSNKLLLKGAETRPHYNDDSTELALKSDVDTVAVSIKTHTDNKSNPHGVTKAQVGLSNVDNTSDKSLLTALSNSNNGVSITVGGTTKSISNISAGEINKTLASSGTIAQTNLIKVSGTTDGYQLAVKADTSDSLEVQHILTDDATTKEVWYGNSTAMMTLQPVGDGTLVTGGNLTINGNVSATNTDAHMSNKSNPHSVTKIQVGLGNVVNTGDSATPVQNGTTKFTTGGAYTELAKKVDKVDGKALSTNDFTSALKTKLEGIETGAQKNTVTSVAGRTGAVTLAKSDVGLGNVDNTSDANKPISRATQAALKQKQGKLTAGTGITIDENNKISATTKSSSFRLAAGTYTLQTLLKMVFTTIPSNYMVTINCPSGDMTIKDENIGVYSKVHCWTYDSAGYQAADYHSGEYVHDEDGASDASEITVVSTSAIQVIISC